MPNIPKLKRIAKRNRLKVFVLLLIAVFSIFYFFIKKDESGKRNIPQPSPVVRTANKSETLDPSPDPNPNLQNLLTKEVQKLPGSYHVYIKDLKTNQIYENKSTEKIASASIYKLAVMYKAYDAIEKGELRKDQQLSLGLTVEQAIRLMITVSDNSSALSLAEKLGWANINNFIKAEGIEGFNLMIKDYPQTTAKATGVILEKIYRKTAVSAEASGEMLELLLAQQLNDRIPAYLPVGTKVAHKTGELDNLRHDAGIVFGKKSDYIFVFLTQTPIPEDAYANIAELSKKLYTALESNAR